jgi:hypothetical protein
MGWSPGNHARTGDIVVVKSREMTGLSPKNTIMGAGGVRGKDDRKQNTHIGPVGYQVIICAIVIQWVVPW